MRIGLLAPSSVPVPPPSYGGTETVVDRLARGLVAAGHQVSLYASGDSTSPVPRPPGAAAACDAAGRFESELRHSLLGHEALADCDVVHDHTLVGPLLAAQQAGDGPAVVATCHAPFEPPFSDVYVRTAEQVPLIAISRCQAAKAARHGVEVTAVIHHGIDPDEVSPGAGSGGYLLFLGRMSPDKGADLAVQVARRAGLPLRIAAKMRSPEEQAWFRYSLEPMLGGDVEYVGEADRDDKHALLADAVALVNPIRWDEPFGMVMLESLAAATPVLAFPNGAAPEIVEDGVTGFLCRDVDEMAARAAEVGNLDRRACRAVVETSFCTERMVREHLEVYTRLTSPPTPQMPYSRHRRVTVSTTRGDIAISSGQPRE